MKPKLFLLLFSMIFLFALTSSLVSAVQQFAFCSHSGSTACGGEYPYYRGSIALPGPEYWGTSKYPRVAILGDACSGGTVWAWRYWIDLCSRNNNVALCSGCGGRWPIYGGQIWLPVGTSSYPGNYIYDVDCGGVLAWRSTQNWIGICSNDDSARVCWNNNCGSNFKWASSIWTDPGTQQWPKNWVSNCGIDSSEKYNWTSSYWLVMCSNQKHASSKCFDHDVYWYDDAGNRRDKKEELPYGCSGGSCLSSAPAVLNKCGVASTKNMVSYWKLDDLDYARNPDGTFKIVTKDGKNYYVPIFSNKANDSIGTNTGNTSKVSLNYGASLYGAGFSTLDSSINLGNNASLNFNLNNQFTIEAWITGLGKPYSKTRVTTDALHGGRTQQFQVVGDTIYYVWERDGQIYLATSGINGSGISAMQITSNSNYKSGPQFQVAGDKIYLAWTEQISSKGHIYAGTFDLNTRILSSFDLSVYYSSSIGFYYPHFQVVGDRQFYVWEGYDSTAKRYGVWSAMVSGANVRVRHDLDTSDYVSEPKIQVAGSSVYIVYTTTGKSSSSLWLEVGNLDFTSLSSGYWYNTVSWTNPLTGVYYPKSPFIYPPEADFYVNENKIYYIIKDNYPTRSPYNGNGNYAIWTAKSNLDGSGMTFTQVTGYDKIRFTPKMQIVGDKIYYAWVEDSYYRKLFMLNSNLDGSGLFGGLLDETSTDAERFEELKMQVIGSEIYYNWHSVNYDYHLWLAKQNSNIIGKGDTYGIGSALKIGPPQTAEIQGFLGAGVTRQDYNKEASPYSSGAIIKGYVNYNNWNHVAITYDNNAYYVGEIFSLYVNGENVGSIANPNIGNIEMPSLDMLIGDNFKGTVDEVAVYNRALSYSDIRQHYQNGYLYNQSYCVIPPDTDKDGIENSLDNCPNTPNPNQEDSDISVMARGTAYNVMDNSYYDQISSADLKGYSNLTNYYLKWTSGPYIGKSYKITESLGSSWWNYPGEDYGYVTLEMFDVFAGSGRYGPGYSSLVNGWTFEISHPTLSDGGNACDNCPSLWSRNQSDTDHNGIGDVCDAVANVTQCDSGIVSYWKLDRSASDLMDINNGTANALYGAVGKVNTAASFDGSNGYVSVNDDNSLDITDKITIEAWINPAAGNAYPARILDKGDDDPNNLWEYSLLMANNDNVEFSLTTSNGLTELATDDSSLPAGQWRHVAGVYNGTHMSLYINGTLKKIVQKTGAIETSSQKLVIGARSLDYNQKFKGIIDEVALWNRALTENEIKQHYINGQYKQPYCSKEAEGGFGYVGIDIDADTINDSVDNCAPGIPGINCPTESRCNCNPAVFDCYNPGQEDANNNSKGDKCEGGVITDDDDHDGVYNMDDNCWFMANTNQEDADLNCPDPIQYPYTKDPLCGDVCQGKSGIYWADMSGKKITNADKNDTVKVIVTADVPDGTVVWLEVWKKGIPGLSSDTRKVSNWGQNSILKGKTVATWPPTEEGKYYFNISVVGYPALKNTSYNLDASDKINNSAPFVKITNPKNGDLKNAGRVVFNSLAYDVDDEMAYLWYFSPEEATKNEESPEVDYPNEEGKGGPKTIILLAKDSRGKTAMDSIKILIDTMYDDAPLAIISSPENGSSFMGYNIMFDARLSRDDVVPKGITFDKLNFTWVFDDGDPIHTAVKGMKGALFNKTFISAGPHWVQLTVSDQDPTDNAKSVFKVGVSSQIENIKEQMNYKDALIAAVLLVLFGAIVYALIRRKARLKARKEVMKKVVKKVVKRARKTAKKAVRKKKRKK